MLALLGLDRAVAAGAGATQFEGTVSGAWRAPLRVKARLWGAGLDADADGTAEPWAKEGAGETKSSVSLRVRSADISPLLNLKPSDPAATIRLSSRVTLGWRQADLRRSRQHRRRFAAARPPGLDARRSEGRRR